MRQASRMLTVETRGPGLYEITAEVEAFVDDQGGDEGLLTLFCRHTSASLTVQENADPAVRRDLQDALGALAPHDPARYRHGAEGADDMPAHIRAALTDVSLSIPVIDRRPALGTWQGVFLWEHRDLPHTRRIAAHLLIAP